MTYSNPDEDVPVTGMVNPYDLKEKDEFTVDEQEESTLRQVYKILSGGLADLDKWHAFDLTESELKLKQQIKAHAIAASLLAPAVEAVAQALATVDEKFRRRNNK